MDFFQKTGWHYFALFVIAAGIYANTLHHDFVLDDEVVITHNRFVQQGISGIPSIFSHDSFAGYRRVDEGSTIVEGGRYRPLSLTFFALLYSVFGAKPFVYHLFSIIIYAATTVFLFRLLWILLRDRSYGKWIAWFTALLFAVHPVHTEVVANVKGCDEQLALFFGIASMYAVLKWWDLKNSNWMILSGIFFLLACLSKENAIIFLITTPLAILFFRESAAHKIFRYALPGLTASIIFLIIRYFALDAAEITLAADPLNNPFLEWNGQAWVPVSAITKYATALYTFGHYIRLMIFPYPLTHDYYPFHITVQNFSNPYVLLGLMMLIGLTVYGLLSIKRKGIAGFGILFFLLALSITLNIFFAVGTFMAERFLYMPSVGFILAAVVLIVHLIMDYKIKFMIPAVYVIAAFLAFLTINRNRAWKDIETLLRTDFETSHNSIKLRNDLGTVLLTKALQSDAAKRPPLLKEAYDHLKFAADTHKTYYDALLAYGAASFYLQKYDESVKAYGRAFELYPQDPMAKTGLLYALQGHGVDQGNKGDPKKAITIFSQAWQLQPDTTSAIELSKYYYVLNQPAKAIEWLEQATLLVPNDAKLKYRLAKAYRDAGNAAAATETYRNAKELDPSLPEL